MKRFILFLLIPIVLLSAAPNEALHTINCFLMLKRFESVSIISLLDAPVTMDVETSFCARKGVTFKASETVPMFYRNEWVFKPFVMEDDEEIKVRYTHTYMPNLQYSAKFLSHILKVQGDIPCYFSVDYEIGNDLLAKPINLTLYLQKEPASVLIFPPFKLSTLTETIIESFPYVTYFKDHLIPKLGGFEAYHDYFQERYDAFVKTQDDIPHDVPYQIPLNVFTIWLIDPANPRGLSKASQKILQNNRDILRGGDGWTHFFYVNRLSDCPKLSEFANILELAPLFNEAEYSPLKDVYENALAEGNYGKASDIARLVVLHKMGGIYYDTDYSFLQSPKRLHQICHFYGGMECAMTLAPCNAIIASKAGHPVIKYYMDVVKEGVGHLNLPEALNNPVKKTLFETGPYAMARAFFEKKGEHDILFPPFIFYYPPYLKDQNGERVVRKSWPLSAIGYHEHFMDWVQK